MDCIIWEHIMVGDKMGLKTFYGARCSSELNRLIKNTKYSYPEWNGTETANRIVDVFDVHEALL